MGEYYNCCFLNSKKRNYPNKKKVRAYVHPNECGCGSKLMEFSWIGAKFMNIIEYFINKEHGEYAGCPVVFAGDYADCEPFKLFGEKWNIRGLGMAFSKHIVPTIEGKHYRYLINEDKKVFFDMFKVNVSKITEWEGERKTWRVHPLAILCCDGTGRGGGSYWGSCMREVGAWKRNVVVTSDNRPNESEYREVFYNFKERP